MAVWWSHTVGGIAEGQYTEHRRTDHLRFWNINIFWWDLLQFTQNKIPKSLILFGYLSRSISYQEIKRPMSFPPVSEKITILTLDRKLRMECLEDSRLWWFISKLLTKILGKKTFTKKKILPKFCFYFL